MIPHFEKMLYDNALLLPLYAQFWQISGDDAYRRISLETSGWLLREMRSPEGVFYSALDADSAGIEGKFYVWQPDEIRALLTDDEFAVCAAHFGLDRPANFEGDWHLHVTSAVDEIAQAIDQSAAVVRRKLDAARDKLLQARSQRVRPGLDDKILTSWNALTIRGLAITARALQDAALSAAATEALAALCRLALTDQQLYATWKQGRARYQAYLDDYAFLLDATLEVLQTQWNSEYLHLAVRLADDLLERFSDVAEGGFFFTADDHEQLIHRSKPLSDEALPSGNAVASLALNRLGLLLGETRYIDAATATVRAAGAALDEFPRAHTTLINALDEILHPGEIIILRGKEQEITRWALAIGAVYTPGRQIYAIPDDAADLPEALAVRKPADGTIAYVCRGTTCSQPLASLEDIAAELER